ncbi:MAG: helix-turn-helix domain-containing protein [Bdellovibrionaceae bacterium]|nr:helix-turn-helix domain-containing protein [Pseudobdellovibrionaceae bacterium]
MSKLPLPKQEKESAEGLLALLKKAEKPMADVIELKLKKESFHELVGLVELLVGDDDLSPADAGKLAKVSRPVIIHLLETGILKGYPVKSQWRIKRDSLMKYIEERESFAKSMQKLDELGYGMD